MNELEERPFQVPALTCTTPPLYIVLDQGCPNIFHWGAKKGNLKSPGGQHREDPLTGRGGWDGGGVVVVTKNDNAN